LTIKLSADILKVWKKEDNTVDENELVNKEPTKVVIKANVNPEAEVELKVTGLEEYTEYIERIEVKEQINTVIGENVKIRTYCSGKSIRCEKAERCANCIDGICNKVTSISDINTFCGYTLSTGNSVYRWPLYCAYDGVRFKSEIIYRIDGKCRFCGRTSCIDTSNNDPLWTCDFHKGSIKSKLTGTLYMSRTRKSIY